MPCSLKCGSAGWNKRLQSWASRSFELLSSKIVRSMCLTLLISIEGRPCAMNQQIENLPYRLFLANGYCTRQRNDHFTRDYPSSILERWYQTLQDLDAVLVGPVVKDPSKKVYIRSLDRLLNEEIVHHELHSALQLRSIWQILYYAMRIWTMLSHGDTEASIRTTNVNECHWPSSAIVGNASRRYSGPKPWPLLIMLMVSAKWLDRSGNLLSSVNIESLVFLVSEKP